MQKTGYFKVTAEVDLLIALAHWGADSLQTMRSPEDLAAVVLVRRLKHLQSCLTSFLRLFCICLLQRVSGIS